MSRLWAVGDVHGFSIALSRLLDRIQPEREDTLVFLGDYVDRGPDTRGVLTRLIQLQKECRTVFLRGNHEAMLLELWEREKNGTLEVPKWKRLFAKKTRLELADWIQLGGRQTIASYGMLSTRISQMGAEHLDFLVRTQLFYETEDFIFTHAAYIPELAMEDQPLESLLYHRLRVSVPQPHFSGKKVYVGHSAQKTGEILDLGHLVCIDTYLYGGGWLTAAEVKSGQIIQVDAAGRKRN